MKTLEEENTYLKEHSKNVEERYKIFEEMYQEQRKQKAAMEEELNEKKLWKNEISIIESVRVDELNSELISFDKEL